MLSHSEESYFHRTKETSTRENSLVEEGTQTQVLRSLGHPRARLLHSPAKQPIETITKASKLADIRRAHGSRAWRLAKCSRYDSSRTKAKQRGGDALTRLITILYLPICGRGCRCYPLWMQTKAPNVGCASFTRGNQTIDHYRQVRVANSPGANRYNKAAHLTASPAKSRPTTTISIGDDGLDSAFIIMRSTTGTSPI